MYGGLIFCSVGTCILTRAATNACAPNAVYQGLRSPMPGMYPERAEQKHRAKIQHEPILLLHRLPLELHTIQA